VRHFQKLIQDGSASAAEMVQARAAPLHARPSCDEASEPETEILGAALLRASPYPGKMFVMKFVSHEMPLHHGWRKHNRRDPDLLHGPWRHPYELDHKIPHRIRMLLLVRLVSPVLVSG
jgi:hypothetical protein